MATTIHWRGNIIVSKAADDIVAVTDAEIEFTAGIWQQKQILIEALEDWLDNWDREFGYHDRQASKMRHPNA